MRRSARLARAAALCALALLASVPPLFAQDSASEERSSIQRNNTTPQGTRRGSRIEALRERRTELRRQAPPGFEAWMRDMRPLQRRALERRLHRMPAPQREGFFREWSRLSVRERRELADRLSPSEARRRRELPPGLRTPEVRKRLEGMSVDERREFVARVREWRGMNPAERRAMRERLERFGTLPEGDQQKLVDERFQRSSPEERARILRELRASSAQLRELRALRQERASEAQPRPPSDPPPQ